MTEAEWLYSADWFTLWNFARDEKYLSDRKARLLAVAACRELGHLIDDIRLVRMIELAEEWADATTEPDDAWWKRHEDWNKEAISATDMCEEDGWLAAWAYVGLGNNKDTIGRALESAAWVYGRPYGSTEPPPYHCRPIARLIPELVGNPFRSLAVGSSWFTSTAVGIAQNIYDDRAFDRLPILADALQDAGCEDDDILAHCRGDGPHVRGCWVVDLVLGKS